MYMDITLPPILRLPDDVWESISSASGWCWREKAELIYTLTSSPNVRAGVEIGVFGGRSLLPMCLGLAKNQGIAYGYDPYEKHRVYQVDQSYWDKLDYDGLMHEAMGLLSKYGISTDVLQRKRSLDASLNHPGGIQFLHIDGSHYMWDTVLDLALWTRKLDVGGWLLLDDTNYDAVVDSAVLLKPGGFEYSCTTFNDNPTAKGEAQLWQKVSAEHQ